MPILWLCLLAACGDSTAADLAPPPAALLDPCTLPLALPDRDATQSEVERWWGHDRSALRECAGRQALLAHWAAGQLAAGL